jgi:hypothetical protein
MKDPVYLLSPIDRQHILGIIDLFEKPFDIEKLPGSVDREFIHITDLGNARQRSVTNKST